MGTKVGRKMRSSEVCPVLVEWLFWLERERDRESEPRAVTQELKKTEVMQNHNCLTRPPLQGRYGPDRWWIAV